ncbi:MAG: hypothetical protein MHM6MM_002219 [Cercozoa sp. M6MM]
MDKRNFDMSDPLYQYDAGTDAGLNFKSADSPIPVNSTDRVVKMLQRAGNDITSSANGVFVERIKPEMHRTSQRRRLRALCAE